MRAGKAGDIKGSLPPSPTKHQWAASVFDPSPHSSEADMARKKVTREVSF
jgi:hypothetical protein